MKLDGYGKNGFGLGLTLRQAFAAKTILGSFSFITPSKLSNGGVTEILHNNKFFIRLVT